MSNYNNQLHVHVRVPPPQGYPPPLKVTLNKGILLKSTMRYEHATMINSIVLVFLHLLFACKSFLLFCLQHLTTYISIILLV
ncbi:unnamed protein product [Trifolium pratense]|uniref:Uncharacterized protein n=1 Tax=Trifolium pratense TaxID=57577 RepID=A0ACB0IMD5_TRIPR|nr:unnamed protein product [Trifolium pratense]